MMNNEVVVLSSPVNANYVGTVNLIRLETTDGEVFDAEVGVYGPIHRRECETLSIWLVDEENVRHELKAGDPRYYRLAQRAEIGVADADRERLEESQEP